MQVYLAEMLQVYVSHIEKSDVKDIRCRAISIVSHQFLLIDSMLEQKYNLKNN